MDTTALAKQVVDSWSEFLRNDEGASMFEFALVGTIFTAILLGMIEFGLAAWQKNSAAADAREGARYAIVRGETSGHIATPDSVATFVKSHSSLDTAGLFVYTTWSPDKKPGSVVAVSVVHRVPRRGPFIPAHRDSATSKMQIYF